MADPQQESVNTQIMKSFLGAYEKVYGPLSPPPTRSGLPHTQETVLFSKLMEMMEKIGKSGGLKAEIAEKLIDAMEPDDIRGRGFLTIITARDLAGKPGNENNISRIFDKYTQATGLPFPPEASGDHYDANLMRALKQPEKLSAYLSQYPVAALVDQQNIEKSHPGYKVDIKNADVIQHIKDSPSVRYTAPDIMQIRNPEIQNYLLQHATTSVKNAGFMVLEADHIKRGNPDADRYIKQAVETNSPQENFKAFKDGSPELRGILRPYLMDLAANKPLDTLISIGDGLENDFKNYKPFLDKLKPNLLEDYRKNNYTTYIVAGLNSLHNQSRADRFSLLDGFTASEVYDITTLARQHHYTSTFNGVFDTLLDRMKNEGKTLGTLVSEDDLRMNGLPTLIEAASTFNRGKDLLRSLNDQDKHLLVDTVLPRLSEMTPEDRTYANYDIPAISGLLSSIDKNDPLLKYAESRLIENYAHADPAEKIDIGLTASWYAKNSGRTPSPENAAFFNKFANDPKYSLPDMKTLPVKDLVDEKGRNFQLHMFYNDEDGINSYASFKNTLKRDGWREDNQKDFTSFTKEKNGRSINLLVSRPESDGAGADAIKKHVEAQHGQISVMVHRGHSYHVDKSFPHITESNKLVFLGSCGSQQNVSAVLAQSPDAQIVSTAGTGRMAINNQSFVAINSQILGSREIDWKGMKDGWIKSAANNPSLAEDYRNYVPPYENWTLLFQKKKEQLLDEEDDLKKPQSNLNKQFENSTMGEVQRELASVDPAIKGPAANEPVLNPSLRA